VSHPNEIALGAGYHKYEGNVTMLLTIYGMQQVAKKITGIKLPNSGHWIPEEQPQFLADQLLKFFGNTK